MRVSRREFLKGVGVVAASAVTMGWSKRLLADEKKRPPARFSIAAQKLKSTCEEIPCMLCSVGCGLRIRVAESAILQVEGATEHPINGTSFLAGKSAYRSLCGKPFHIARAMNIPPEERVKVLRGPVKKAAPIGAGRLLRGAFIRKSGEVGWKQTSVENAISRAAELIKATHSAHFEEYDGDGRRVNRCEAIGFIGGSGLSNEECYAAQKLFRGLGLVYIDSVIRNSLAPTIHALKATFGRPGATNPIPDIANAKAVLIVGADPATEAPVVMRYVFEATMRNDAKVVCIDSRHSGTAARAHIHAAVRPGTEFALILGMINFILENGGYVEDFIRENTDAQFIIVDEFRTVADTDGVFSGLKGDDYDGATWKYALRRDGRIDRDDRMRHPRTLLKVMKKHFRRYNESAVCRVTGLSRQTFRRICEAFCTETSTTGSSGVILFGRGLTARSTGTQAVRALAILQLLLGNIGKSGGGLIPVVSEGNAQGAADFGLLYEFLPGYLPAPTADLHGFNDYMNRHKRVTKEPDSFNEWGRIDAYLASYLCDMYGDTDRETAYSYLPKLDPKKDYSIYGLLTAIEDGRVEGLVVMGEDPVAELNAERWAKAVAKLKWLVVFDWMENDTAEFFKDGKLSSSRTEVVLIPAMPFVERQGSFTNITRWLQWQRSRTIVAASTDRIEGLKFLDRLFSSLSSGGTGFDASMSSLNWESKAMRDPEFVITMINGLDFKSGTSAANRKKLRGRSALKADGSTQCANHYYCGCISKSRWHEGTNSISDRSGVGLYHDWGWAWPDNVRVMYNRASVRRDGTPFDKPLVTFSPPRWKGGDIVDGPHNKSPKEIAPFTATPDGVARLFAPDLRDGPLPAYYEEPDLPFPNHFTPRYRNSPVLLRRIKDSLPDRPASGASVVALRFSLGEHLGAGSATRRIPFFSSLTNGFFVEVDGETAELLGIKNGSKVRLRNERLKDGVVLPALVTKRLRRFSIGTTKVGTVAVCRSCTPYGLIRDGAFVGGLFPASGDTVSKAASEIAYCIIEKV